MVRRKKEEDKEKMARQITQAANIRNGSTYQNQATSLVNNFHDHRFAYDNNKNSNNNNTTFTGSTNNNNNINSNTSHQQVPVSNMPDMYYNTGNVTYTRVNDHQQLY